MAAVMVAHMEVDMVANMFVNMEDCLLSEICCSWMPVTQDHFFSINETR